MPYRKRTRRSAGYSPAQQKSRDSAGKAAESLTRDQLRVMGAKVFKIPNAWTVFRDRDTGEVEKAWPKARVQADSYGHVVGTGRSVLVEVKNCSTPGLGYGKLGDHQHDALREHDADGGISIVAVLYAGAGLRLFRYPVLGWRKGAPLRPDDASAIPFSTRLAQVDDEDHLRARDNDLPF